MRTVYLALTSSLVHTLTHCMQVALEALHAERNAVARLQRVCAEMASASIHAGTRSSDRAQGGSGPDPTATMDSVLQVSCVLGMMHLCWCFCLSHTSQNEGLKSVARMKSVGSEGMDQ
jgi:hypothetical protein